MSELSVLTTAIETCSRLVAQARQELVGANYLQMERPDLGSQVCDAIDLTSHALSSEPAALRGDIATAHARIKRLDLPHDDAPQVWVAIHQISDELERMEILAAGLELPGPLNPIDLPRQYLVPRPALANDMTQLTDELATLETTLAALSEEKSSAPDLQQQNRLIDYVVHAAKRRSKIARLLSTELYIDVRGLVQTAAGLGNLAASFYATVNAAIARVTEQVRTLSGRLTQETKDIVSHTGKIASLKEADPDWPCTLHIEGRKYPLHRSWLDSPFGAAIGSSSEFAHVSFETRVISRRHLRVFREEGRFWVEDLGSMNGSELAGRALKPFQPTPIADGAIVVIAETPVEIAIGAPVEFAPTPEVSFTGFFLESAFNPALVARSNAAVAELTVNVLTERLYAVSMISNELLRVGKISQSKVEFGPDRTLAFGDSEVKSDRLLELAHQHWAKKS